MDWSKFLTIILANVGVMIAVMGFFTNRLHKDIDSVNSHIDRLDRIMDGHSRRIDQLYVMFCDLLKEKR